MPTKRPINICICWFRGGGGTHCTENISRTSAVSSTNFRSILIFASCVVGTCNILTVWVSFYWEGSYVLSTIMVSVGIFALCGEF